MLQKKLGIYWGSFDPPTFAHKDIIIKSFSYVSFIFIVINNNGCKKYFFSSKKRLIMFKYMFRNYFSIFSFYDYKIYFYIQNKDNYYNYLTFMQIGCNVLNIILGIDVYNNWIYILKKKNINFYKRIYIIYRSDLLIVDNHFLNLFFITINSNFKYISSKLSKNYIYFYDIFKLKFILKFGIIRFVFFY